MVCLLFTVLGEFLHVVCLIQGRFYCSFFFFFFVISCSSSLICKNPFLICDLKRTFENDFRNGFPKR